MKKNNKVKNLSSSIIKGTSWLALFQVLDNVLGFVRLIIIARLLSPHDFGLIGIALLTLQILNTFSQTGIQQFIVHKKQYMKFLDVGWTYLIIRSFILYAIVYFSAPYIAIFFNNSAATDVIRVIGLSLLFDGASNIGVILFQKQMTFKKQFVYQLSGNLTDFLVALIFAILIQNVWALVLGTIANSIARFIASYILSTYKPKLSLKFRLIMEANNYGKWIFGSNILQFIYSQGDDILVGRLLGSVSLGYYQLAYRVSNLPATQITHLVGTVMFPAYSKIQSSKERLVSSYLSTLKLISFLSFFVSGIIICFAYDFTYLFLGNQWLPIVVSLQILTLWGAIRSVGATTGPIWQGIGTPGVTTKIQILQVIILTALIYPLTMNYGIEGTSTAVVIAALIPNLVSLHLISQTLQVKKRKLISNMFYPFIASITMGIVFFSLRNNFAKEPSFITFVLLAIISFMTYFAVCYIFHKFFGYTGLELVKKILLNNLPNNKISNSLKSVIIRI